MSDDRSVTRLTVGSLTDPGINRDHQEDSVGYFSPFEAREYRPWARYKGNLYVVADGVGGREAGEVASRLAVNAVLDEFYRSEGEDVGQSLLQAIQMANERIVRGGIEQGRPGRMRTTIVCAVIRGRDLLVANAGDSRAYLVRGGSAEQLTEDHTLVAQWLRDGQLKSEEVVDHPQSHVITQSLGDPRGVEPGSRWEEIRAGDIVVLCSDGLYGVVGDQEIAQAVSRSVNPQNGCKELVDLANERSGPDNISVIVIRVDSVAPEPEPGQSPRTSLPNGFGVRP